MTEPPYSGPPPTGSYRAPPQLPPNYGPPGWVPGWPTYPPYPAAQPDPRPSGVTAAAVLGWITAGLLLLAAGLLFFGAAFLHGIEAATGPASDYYVAEFTFDGIVNVVAAGLSIAGGVQLTSRSATGRLMLSGGAGIVLLEALYWLVRWTSRTGATVVGYALLFAALAVASMAYGWSRPVSRWLRRS